MLVPHRREDAEFGDARRAADQLQDTVVLVRFQAVLGDELRGDFRPIHFRLAICHPFIEILTLHANAVKRPFFEDPIATGKILDIKPEIACCANTLGWCHCRYCANYCIHIVMALNFRVALDFQIVAKSYTSDISVPRFVVAGINSKSSPCF